MLQAALKTGTIYTYTDVYLHKEFAVIAFQFYQFKRLGKKNEAI